MRSAWCPETGLLLHPTVAAVSVVGRPDPQWGESVVAFVVAEATSFVVARSTITRSFEVVQGGVARLTGSSIAGEVLVDGQPGAVTVSNNRVGLRVAGNVEVFNNGGGTTINSNRIGGNLQCKDNLPAPTGSGNIVAGNKEDQVRHRVR